MNSSKHFDCRMCNQTSLCFSVFAKPLLYTVNNRSYNIVIVVYYLTLYSSIYLRLIYIGLAFCVNFCVHSRHDMFNIRPATAKNPWPVGFSSSKDTPLFFVVRLLRACKIPHLDGIPLRRLSASPPTSSTTIFHFVSSLLSPYLYSRSLLSIVSQPISTVRSQPILGTHQPQVGMTANGNIIATSSMR